MPEVSNTSFIKRFNSLARHQHRYKVFSDFVTMSAISLHNAINKSDTLEQEYLDIVGKYSKEEVNEFPKLLGELVELLEQEPKDVLGGLYMVLELGNDNVGQFFTPHPISEFMAQVLYGDELKKMDKPFITLSEPACGAGGMVLAFVKVMISQKLNPAEKLFAQCIDIDRLSALMCYIQLALWNVPAQIIVGNSLSMEYREVFYTPAYYLGNWQFRLATREAKQLLTEESKPDVQEIEVFDKPEPKSTVEF